MRTIKDSTRYTILYNLNRGKKMTTTMKKVKVIPKSEKYTRQDLEQALNEVYDDYGYILDFMKEYKKYVVLYLKERDV